MSGEDWKQTRERFAQIVGEVGVRKVANAMRRDPKTVYRVLKQDTRWPHPSTRDEMRRVIRNPPKP